MLYPRVSNDVLLLLRHERTPERKAATSFADLARGISSACLYSSSSVVLDAATLVITRFLGIDDIGYAVECWRFADACTTVRD